MPRKGGDEQTAHRGRLARGRGRCAGGVQLAAEQEGECVFLHVVDAVDVVAPAFGPIIVNPVEQPGRRRDSVRRRRGRPRAWRAVRAGLVAGFDYETILATADEIDAELIVLGSNRHGTLGTTFFGSVSKELLKRARRPCLSSIPAAPVAATV